MNRQNRLLAAFGAAGTVIAIATGLALADTNKPDTKPPANAPVSVSVAATSSSAAIPTETVAATVAPLTTKARPAVHQKRKTRRAAAVLSQEPTVTDPQPTGQPPQPDPSSYADLPQTHGSGLRHGPSNAPASTADVAYPDDTLSPSPKE